MGVEEVPQYSPTGRTTNMDYKSSERAKSSFLPEVAQPRDNEETSPKYAVPTTSTYPAFDPADAPEHYPHQQHQHYQHPMHDHYQSHQNQHVAHQMSPHSPNYGHAHPYYAEQPQEKNPYYLPPPPPPPVPVDQGKSGRTYCGMRKGLFIALVVGAILVILAVVLGAALGSTLNKDSDTTQDSGKSSVAQPVATFNNTGISSAFYADGSNTMLLYSQSPNGSIVENRYPYGSWESGALNSSTQMFVTTDAVQQSPLAAVSYTFGNDIYRQVFYSDSVGNVKQVNATGFNGTFGEPSIVSDETILFTGPALAACQGDETFNSVRVYYGSNKGAIREMWWAPDKAAQGWQFGEFFNGSDAFTGVACSTSNNSNTVNVYMRNATTTKLIQWYMRFDDLPYRWNAGPTVDRGFDIAQGSAIGSTTDHVNNDYVFYQGAADQVIRGVIPPSTDHNTWAGFNNLTEGGVSTRFGAVYAGGDAMVFFQDQDPTKIQAKNLTRNGFTNFEATVSS